MKPLCIKTADKKTSVLAKTEHGFTVEELSGPRAIDLETELTRAQIIQAIALINRYGTTNIKSLNQAHQTQYIEGLGIHKEKHRLLLSLGQSSNIEKFSELFRSMGLNVIADILHKKATHKHQTAISHAKA